MSQEILFPFADYYWIYLGFLLFVFLMLILDLGIFHRKPHEVSTKESVSWTFVWVSCALIFNYAFYEYSLHRFTVVSPLPDGALVAQRLALEFFSGFIIEKSLAIDNVFVFIVVFNYFAIPKHLQHSVLFWGILGALIFRALFIALGSLLLQFHWVMLVAGAFLILTGLKILFAPEEVPDPAANPFIRLVKRWIPITPNISGQKFILRINKNFYATPLLLTLVFIEFSDIVFALDSVPAIFGISKEPLIVFTSNIFAILGLRSLYFLFSGAVTKLRFMNYGLGTILIFVGLKMTWLDGLFEEKFPILWSLGIIGAILALTVLFSLAFKPRKSRQDSKP